MSEQLSFTITHHIELEDLLGLTDDDTAKELLHDAYMLSGDPNRRLVELQQMAVRAQDLEEKGVCLEGWDDKTELRCTRRFLGEALYSTEADLSTYNRDRISIIRAILICIECEDDVEELVDVLERRIGELKGAISPF
jgi:hypothetical protein